MITKASLPDLKEIKKLTEACASKLQQKKIFQWNENYPSMEQLQRDIENDELYLLREDTQIKGIVMLSFKQDEIYKSVNWLTKTTNHLYVHRLAVHPKHWGKGYARTLMNFAEDYARSHNCVSIRLDTFSQNKRNQRFYKAREYKQLEDVYFPKKSKHPFHCYELLL
ncbi:GNAT family N-acetyltransferase [Salegentibacter sp. F14]